MELQSPRAGLGHTIPPIIIKSVDSNLEPVEIELEEELVQDRALLEKVQYKIEGLDLTRWVVVELRSTSGDWVKYGFGRKRGLEVRLSLQVKQGNQWVTEQGAPHLVIDGRSENFPLTTEELSDDIQGNNNDRPHKRRYKDNDNKKRRIGIVEVVGFEPLSTVGNEFVEVAFFDEDH